MFTNLLGQSKAEGNQFFDEEKNPEFERASFASKCENRAKTAHTASNDATCCENIESLVAECIRLSAAATEYKKTLVGR